MLVILVARTSMLHRRIERLRERLVDRRGRGRLSEASSMGC